MDADRQVTAEFERMTFYPGASLAGGHATFSLALVYEDGRVRYLSGNPERHDSWEWIRLQDGEEDQWGNKQRLKNVLQVDRSSHSLALHADDGNVYAWGANDEGQCGIGHENDEVSEAVSVVGPDGAERLTGVRQVAARDRQSLALTEDGEVLQWGRISDEEKSTTDSPIKLLKSDGTPLSGIASIAAGEMLLTAVGHDGSLWTWDEETPPDLVEGITDAVEVSIGREHVVVLLSDGTVRVWGDNEYGQLGAGHKESVDGIVEVEGLENIVSIDTGQYYTLALNSEGEVYAWGRNHHGQLGDGTQDNRPVPVKTQELDNVHMIAANDGFRSASYALADDGQIYYWGAATHQSPNMATLLPEEEEAPNLGEVDVDTVSLQTAVAGDKGGKVFPKSGVYQYNHGDEVELRALPDDDYRFVRWSDGHTAPWRTVVLEEDRDLTAVFALIETTMRLENVEASPNEPVKMRLLMEDGKEPYAGFNAALHLPDGIGLAGASRGGDLGNGFQFDYTTRSAPEGGTLLSLIAFSADNSVDVQDGEWAVLTLRATSRAEGGTLPVSWVDGRAWTRCPRAALARDNDEGGVVRPIRQPGSITLDVKNRVHAALRVAAQPAEADQMSDAEFDAYRNRTHYGSDESYMAEIWLRVTGSGTAGIESAYMNLDVRDTERITEKTVEFGALQHGSLFSSSTGGTTENSSLRNFGGEVAESNDAGRLDWVRLGWTEVIPENDTAVHSIALSAGDEPPAIAGEGELDDMAVLDSPVTVRLEATGREALQEALDEGGSVEIGPDTYKTYEPLEVNVDGTTLTTPDATLDAEGGEVAIVINADDVTVEGFTIRNFLTAGIDVRGDRAVIKNNTIDGADACDGEPDNAGIRVDGAEDTRIVDNSIFDAGKGVMLYGAAEGTLMSNNRITRNRTGIAGVADGDQAPIRTEAFGNRIYDNIDCGADWAAGTDELDARLNWWGQRSGPAPVGGGDRVSGNVSFEPWTGAEITGSFLVEGTVLDRENIKAGVSADIDAGAGHRINVIRTEDETPDPDVPAYGSCASYMQVFEIERDAPAEIVSRIAYHTRVGDQVLWYDGTEWTPCLDVQWNPDQLPPGYAEEGYEGYAEVKIAAETDPPISDSGGITFVVPAETLAHWTLDVKEPEGGGTTNLDPGDHTFDFGEDAAIEARPEEGWKLSHWVLDGTEVFVDKTAIEVPAGTGDETQTLRAVFITEIAYQIHRAEEGDTIELDPGVYTAEVPIKLDVDDLTLRSRGGREVTDIMAEERDRGLIIEADGVRLEGFTVWDFTGTGIVVKGKNAEIVDNTITGDGEDVIGVHVDGTAEVKNTRLGANIVSGNDVGILLSGDAGKTIVSNNTLTENGIGIANEVVNDSFPEETAAINNNIEGNEIGVSWEHGTAPLQAQHNWWGHATKPAHADNPNGEGDPVEGNVNYGDPDEKEWFDSERKGRGSGRFVSGIDEKMVPDIGQAIDDKLDEARDSRSGVSAAPVGEGGVFATSRDLGELPEHRQDAVYIELTVSHKDKEAGATINEVIFEIGYTKPVERSVYWADEEGGEVIWRQCVALEEWNPDDDTLNEYVEEGHDGYVELTIRDDGTTSPDLEKDFSSVAFGMGTAADDPDDDSDDDEWYECFIASAAYGTAMTEKIDSLRSFRDDVMLKSDAGKTAIKAYYLLSPPFAELISWSDTAREVIRECLEPVVQFSQTVTKTDNKEVGRKEAP